MRTCATPRNGTGYRHNKMNCSDGSIAYCSVNDASEPFAYEELYDGCSSDPRTPGNSFVLEASILMKVKLLICCHLYLLCVLSFVFTECKSPWNRPRHDSLCYMVSEGIMNWDQARQVSRKQLSVLNCLP